jgi:agmatinase
MARYGPMFGPDVTFLGVDRCDVNDPTSYESADVVVFGAPFDGGTSARPRARFGPLAIRTTDYLPHDGSRPSRPLRVDALKDLRVLDAGDVEMYSGDIERSLGSLESAVTTVAASGVIPVTLARRRPLRHLLRCGGGRQPHRARSGLDDSLRRARGHGDIQFGSLWGHGQPMRRLIESEALQIESEALRGDRFLQIGLRGYWPEPETLSWMARKRMRSFEMTEIDQRGLDECLSEAFAIATDECNGVFLSVDIDVYDPGHAPGTGTPEPGGFSARQLLDSVRRIRMELPVVGIDVVEVSPPYDHSDITAALANRVILEALSGLAWKRTKQAGTAWDPARPLLEDR